MIDPASEFVNIRIMDPMLKISRSTLSATLRNYGDLSIAEWQPGRALLEVGCIFRVPV
uniref:Dus domain-containing protein n=1 Tax=Mesocestoides corti TaxID=53468 RepID=A0A5K3FDN0_MESCO